MAITTTEQTSIIKLVLGMFNAAPGATNLSSIVAHYEANGKDLSNLADALASNAAFTDQFAGLVTVSGIANKMAANFGLTSGTAYTNAVAYFEQEITAGKTNQSIMKAAVDYLSGSTVDAVYADVVTTLTNKYTVALDYSVTKQLSAATVAELQAVVASVDATAASVTAAIASNTTGTTYTLTAGLDSLTGTALNDTFNATQSATAAVETFSVSDTINGGAGTDTLNITSLEGAALNIATVTNIENLNIRATVAGADADMDNFVGVTGLSLDRYVGATDVTNVATTTGVTFLNSSATADTTVTYKASTVTGATDSATITLNGVTAGADIELASDVETITLNTTGATSSLADLVLDAQTTTLNIAADEKLTVATTLTMAGVTTATITGDSLVTLTPAIGAAVTALDASGNTGGLVTVLGTNDDIVVTGSTGNDTITANTTDAHATANKLAVNAGTGTDTLIIAATIDVDTAADAARYTGFETIRTADSVNMGLVSGITALQITGGTSETYSALTATQAANITFRAANTTSTILTLASVAGTSDVVTVNLASTTATTNVDVTGLSVIGVETVNVNATTGTNATGDTAFSFLDNTADSVSKVNFTGTADVTFDVAANELDVVAVAIDASAMTGTADFTLSTGVLIAGSTVTTTLNADTIAISSTTGTTYNAGAGNDSLTGSVADLVATGTNDNVIDGGTGTDSLTLDDTTTTLTDNHFTNLSNLETLALSNTVGALSLTTGTAFNTAFASGATITTGAIAASVANSVTINSGLSTVNMNITVDATLMDAAAGGEDVIVTTGTGTDTVTITGDDTWVGQVGDSGAIEIDTGAGNDTISVTTGTIVAMTTSQFLTVNAGTGADTISVTKISADNATSVALYTIDAGDSTTTAWDIITGFDLATATIFSDGLDFTGTAAIGTLATSTDFGTILSHGTVTAGVTTFDDASSYATALVINSSNIADVVGYLAANTATNDVIAFTYDSTSNGTADATMVFHNGSTDSLVQLSADVSVDALITTNASAGTGDLFIA